MRKDLYTDLYQKEDSYWWHVGRRLILGKILEKYVGGKKDLRILDAGCGTGRTMEDLRQYGEVVGLDFSPDALTFCRERGLKSLYQADLSEKLPFADKSFDLITCLDVLEHVKKDKVAMSEFYRILRKGGSLVLTVPAHPRLWSYWDEIIEHQRRYTKVSLENKLEKAGFEIKKISSTNFFIFPLAITIRYVKGRLTREENLASSDFVRVPNFVNWILTQLYCLEALLVEKTSLPLGLSYLVVARK